jgi:hypothetical protein
MKQEAPNWIVPTARHTLLRDKTSWNVTQKLMPFQPQKKSRPKNKGRGRRRAVKSGYIRVNMVQSERA